MLIGIIGGLDEPVRGGAPVEAAVGGVLVAQVDVRPRQDGRQGQD